MLLTIHANCLLRRQLAWNIKAYFLGGGKKKEKNIHLPSAKFAQDMLSVSLYDFQALVVVYGTTVYSFIHISVITIITLIIQTP